MKYNFKGWLSVRDYGEGDEPTIFLYENQTPSRDDIKHEDPLFERICDLCMNGQTVFVRWWSADKKATKEELSAEVAAQALGSADCRYQAVYSDVTGYLWTDNWFKVGGHNIATELESLDGKYVILEIEAIETEKQP